MLAYILAVLVGASSVGLYLWAFFFPEIHRKQDFIWSGVGLFYALFLWLYARQVTGGILVGQTTSVALLGWFAWETFKLRRQLVPVDRSTATIEPNPAQRQDRRDSNRAVPNPVKSTAKTSPQSPAPTSPVATAKTAPPATSIPLAQTKVPPATPDRSTATVSKAAPPQPTPPPASSTPAKVVSPDPTPSTKSSSAKAVPPELTPSNTPTPVTASPQQSPQSIDSMPIEVSTTQPTMSSPANSNPVKEEAWIKLEVKPVSPPSKPLGTPAPPPKITNLESSSQSLAVEPEITTKNIPTDPTPTTTELESENWT
jgi:Ycf66 protein N-terminus